MTITTNSVISVSYTHLDGASQLAPAASTNGSAGTVSIMFMVFAVVFGLIQKKFNLSGWKEAVVGIAFIVASFVIGKMCIRDRSRMVVVIQIMYFLRREKQNLHQSVLTANTSNLLTGLLVLATILIT